MKTHSLDIVNAPTASPAHPPSPIALAGAALIEGYPELGWRKTRLLSELEALAQRLTLEARHQSHQQRCFAD